MKSARSAFIETVRRDRRANFAVLAAIACMIPAAVALMGLLLSTDRTGDRTNPLYWAILLPLAFWAYGLVGFSVWALRLVRPALFAGPVVCAISGIGAVADGGPVLLPLVALGLAMLASAVGLVQFNGSALQVTKWQ